MTSTARTLRRTARNEQRRRARLGLLRIEAVANDNERAEAHSLTLALVAAAIGIIAIVTAGLLP